MNRIKAIAIVALMMTASRLPTFADGYTARGNPNALTTDGAGEGQVPVFGANGKAKWLSQGQLARGQCTGRPIRVNGTTGFYVWGMPEQGSGYKKVVIKFVNYTSPAPSVINFPSPFSYPPDITGGEAFKEIAGPIDTSFGTIPAITSPFSGTISIEGF